VLREEDEQADRKDEEEKAFRLTEVAHGGALADGVTRGKRQAVMSAETVRKS
jgi:hypothetical protein